MDFGVPSLLDPSSESRISMKSATFLGLAFSFLLIFFGQRFLFESRETQLPLPPGPSLLPGSIPDRDIWRTFQQWHARYGPIISLRVGALTVIILGDRQTAHALLDKRGSIYSDRPKSIFIDKYFDRGLFPVLSPANDYWRLHRRLHTALLTTKASEKYHNIQDLESRQLVFEMLSSHDYEKTFHRFAASAMFTLVYGKGLSTDDLGMDEIRNMDEMVELGVKAISIGSFLVDAFPILDRLPRFFSGWKIAAERAHHNTKSAFTRCINVGFYEDGWNWCREVSQRKEAQRLTADQLAYNQGELYVAGSHSARMVMDVFVMTSILQPAAVKKAQQELDRAVGSERLPLFEDMKSLPYMNAFILEILRWRQTTPLAVPHAAAKDDEYMGYRIPAGSIVIANQWQMNMDTEIFDDPDSFNPDRWIDNPELPLSVFGFGRRACPGQHIAHSTLFIAISRLLWAFNITSPDKDLEKQLADQSGRLGAVYVPSKINASFETRSLDRQKVVEKEWESADKDRKTILASIKESSFS